MFYGRQLLLPLPRAVAFIALLLVGDTTTHILLRALSSQHASSLHTWPAYATLLPRYLIYDVYRVFCKRSAHYVPGYVILSLRAGACRYLGTPHYASLTLLPQLTAFRMTYFYALRFVLRTAAAFYISTPFSQTGWNACLLPAHR